MKKDVELVIRARDEATKAADSIVAAFKELVDAQNRVGDSAGKADGLLGRLREELVALNREVQGLSSLGRISQQLDRATAAVGRLEKSVEQASEESTRMAAKSAEAAQSVADLRAKAAEAKSALDAQKRATAAVREESGRTSAAFKEQRARQQELDTAYKNAAAALRAAERNERSLRAGALDAAEALVAQREALDKAQAELREMSTLAGQASTALGGVAATQEAVGQASARAADDIRKVTAALQRQTGGAAVAPASPASAAEATAAYRAQVEAVRAARGAWKEAQGEANRLAGAIRATAEPTREQQTAFLLAQAASRAAKEEYFAQGAALNRLRTALDDWKAAQVQAAAQGRTTSTAQGQVAETAHRAAGGMNTAATAARNVGSAKREAAGGAFRLRDAFRELYGESRKSMSIFQRLRGEALSLTTSYLGLFAVLRQAGGVVTAFQGLEAAESRLGSVFDQDVNRVAVEIAWLRDQALRLGVQFSVLSDEYSKFAIAAQAANFTNAETRRIFLSVAEAGRVNKLSMEQMSGIFLALTQMISKGKITSEELRRQLGDRLPGAFNIMADALGVTTAELDRMMAAGEVLADRDTMTKFADQLTERFGSQLPASLRTVTTEIGRFGENLERSQLRVANAGFIDALAEALRDLNEWFASTEGQKFFDSLGAALGKLVSILPGVVRNFDLILRAFQAFIAIKLSHIVLSLVGDFGGFRGALTKARADVIGLTASLAILGATSTGATRAALFGLSSTLTALRGVMIGVAATARAMWAAIGGLPGLILTGVTFILTEVLGRWLTGVGDTNEALQEHERILDRVRQGYHDAEGAAEDWASRIRDVSTFQIVLNTRELQAELDELRRRTQEVGNIAGDDNPFVDQLNAAIRGFREGAMAAADFKAEVNRIAEADPKLDPGLAGDLLSVADRAAQAERRIEENGAALRVLRGEATEADRALLSLADAADRVNGSLDTSAIDAYTAALRELGEAVPEIKVQMGFDASRRALDEQFNRGVAALWETYRRTEDLASFTRDYNALVERHNQALAALERSVTDSVVNSSLVDRIVGAESSGNAAARNPRSSATGLGQFIESTWLRMFRQYFPDRAEGMSEAAILALRENADLSRQMVELYLRENAAALQAAGRAVTDTNLYLAHFLGPGGAASVLGADRDTPISELLSAAAIRANPTVLGGDATAGSVIDWAAEKMDVPASVIAAQQAVADLAREAVDAQAQFNESIAEGVEQRRFEASLLGDTARDQAIRTALREAETRAADRGVELGDDQRRIIAESVGLLFDQQQAAATLEQIDRARYDLARARGEEESREAFIAREARQAGIDLLTAEGQEWARIKGLIYDVQRAERERSEQRRAVEGAVDDLDEQRRLLMEQITFYQEQGQFGVAGELEAQLEGVNAQLLQAVDAAIAFWTAMGGPGAAAAILQLQNLRNGLEAAGSTIVVTGKQMNDLIADRAVNAFDRFAQAVAEGENVVKSLWRGFLQFAADFLREIAQMILKQAILNALQGKGGPNGGVGGMIAGWINGLFRHEGGPVTSGGSRPVPVSWFANAIRYHGGGIAGLKPNEVPTILEEGEGVFTQDQMKALGGPSSLKVVNILDAADMLARALATETGEKVLLNFVRNNPGAFKAAIG